MTAGNVFQQFYTFADTMVVGRVLGMDALAALGAAEWMVFLMFGSMQGLVQGFSIIVAQRFGRKDKAGLKESVMAAGLLSAVFSFFFLAAFICLPELGRIPDSLIDWKNFHAETKLIREELKMGVPMGCQSMITAAGGLVVQSAVNGFGVLFLAGYTAANKLYGLLETAAVSDGYAMASFAGQNRGAGLCQRIGKGLKAANITGVTTAFLISAFMFFSADRYFSVSLPEKPWL